MSTKIGEPDHRRKLFPRDLRKILQLSGAMLLLSCQLAWSSVTGSISGVVHDASGAVMPGAEVVALNTGKGVKWTLTTDAQGFYSFQALPVGTYDVDISKPGFTHYRQTGLVLDVNSALNVDATLQLGQVMQEVTVTSSAVYVNTTSTQMGEVINGSKITAVPLTTRSYTDLLALQPGVVAVSSGMDGGQGGQWCATGFGMPRISGDLNPGNYSVNGMREAANGFLLNGASVQESAFSGTAIIPNLDSIAEFRILTNNFDAEYGSYAGGQINVITKSGTNEFHGELFEFLRNTDLESRNFFDSARGAYKQNQFGGTMGGRILRNKLFFFADYQGNRVVRGQSSGEVTVPTTEERSGNFSALADLMTGTVQGPAWAEHLSSALGYPVTQGEPYYTAGCTSSADCVFPNAQVPSSAYAAPSPHLLDYIPTPNLGSNKFTSSVAAARLRDDKGSGRVDGNTRLGMLSGYYYFDQYTILNPNATSPSFSSGTTGRSQVISFGATTTFGGTAVNEARLSYARLYEVLGRPMGVMPSLSSLGFVTGADSPGIVPSQPEFEGVPGIGFNTFGIGSGSPLPIIENTYQVLDNFSKVVGAHTVKLGGTFRFTRQIEKNLGSNGSFSFNGSETGIDFADFLIGAPVEYHQGQSYPSHGHNRYAGLYAQDSWRVRPNLTFNIGVRWEFATPWWEENNQIQTLVPGLNSVVFPGSPTGWVFPGDPGIPRTLAPTRYNNVAPRIGLAYSPKIDTGFLGKLTGGPGKTSIRASWGKFYTTFEGATAFNEIGDAPFGYYYGSPVPPEFATPFVNRGDGVSNGQRFPAPAPPVPTPEHPVTDINWANLVPIGSSPGFYYKNTLPYAIDYEFVIERQLSPTTLLTLAYVGTQAHHLLSALSSNPGDPAVCLSVSQPDQVMPGSSLCGPWGENGTYTRADGTAITTTRTRFGPEFQNNAWFSTLGNSNYNSFQANLRRTTGRSEFLAGYTYSKSLSNASGYGEQVNPFNQNQRSLSSFDMTHNFVLSYNLVLPFDKLGGPRRLTNGWRLTGITRFATGLPVTLLETDDRSLTGTSGGGPIQLPFDTPNYAGGKLSFYDPRTVNADGKRLYFDPSGFSPETLGQLGTANRRFFHGPGINNWDIALAKDTRLTERMNLEFRAEFFNAFNHAQFNLIATNYADVSNFGTVGSARDPRIIQFGLKLMF